VHVYKRARRLDLDAEHGPEHAHVGMARVYFERLLAAESRHVEQHAAARELHLAQRRSIFEHGEPRARGDHQRIARLERETQRQRIGRELDGRGSRL
jgi:hypothetical protein